VILVKGLGLDLRRISERRICGVGRVASDVEDRSP
jgi:hypothetical protein